MPSRVRAGHVAWLADRLSPRDWDILTTVNRLRVVSGPQLGRLHFADHRTATASAYSRSQVLARLVRWRVLAQLPRRIGGPAHGSSASVYALDTAGHHLLARQRIQDPRGSRVRRPGVVSDRWTNHTLTVAELYVAFVEAHRAGRLILRDFRAEPHAWWPDGLGGWLKPDAYVVVSDGKVDHLWWVEVDMATESLPTVQHKLRTYLDFDRRGGLGPRQAMPRVLISVPTQHRGAAAFAKVAQRELVHITTHTEVVDHLARLLRTPN
jgi:hypothetical protein